MALPKYLAYTVLITAFGVLILTTASAKRQQEGYKQKAGTQAKEPDFSRFPIADFHAPEPSDENQKAAREARGLKYDDRHMPQISEDTNQIFSNSHWDVRLPALPVERSAAVVIGIIKSAHAYVTPGKTGIYSEFQVAADSVIKNDANNPIKDGATITVERRGGRLRMPSGKIVLSWVSHQNMPRVGGRYLLFLTHEYQTLNDTPKDFYLLTGYEFRDGQVRLLDDTQSGHPITRSDGTNETTLLSDLFNTLAKTPHRSN